MISLDEQQLIQQYLSQQEKATVDFPYTDSLAVYSVNQLPFAYLETVKDPMKVSLRSDPLLAQVLRQKYDEVSPGHKLNPKIWNTIILSGQLSFDEVTALIDHSYQLALGD